MTYYEEIEIMRREHPNTWDYYGVHRDNQVEDYFRDPCSFFKIHLCMRRNTDSSQ